MKKIFLVLGMFLFITNVSALSFDVELTNIEDKGNNGTIGTIERIDFENKTIDAYFQDIGDEVSFSITVVNTGDRAGTLRSIEASGENGKIEYTSDLPEGGLAINGNDTNVVTITAKVKEGATNGTSSSILKITYNYDEGSCPDGEILSGDESMCLCPEGTERNEEGICVEPRKQIECEKDEIYNEAKNICEKKVVPVTPSNPKTLDNIVLITLLFFVSGLGIYAVMFKKLDTNKKKVTVGAITGLVTFGAAFTVLVSVFGLDNLLTAIVNPITKTRELEITVNEKIELIETWDGECSLNGPSLNASNIFEGGSGTETDPYQIKTAEQLSCLVKSVNNGETYQGKFIKQIKNIKLNDKVLENVEAGTTTGLNTWIPAGEIDATDSIVITKSFNGSYDGDNHVISGIYINDPSAKYLGLFRTTKGATIKNLTLSDNYLNGDDVIGTLVALASDNTKIDNVKTYGILNGVTNVAGIVGDSTYTSVLTDYPRIENSINYADITANQYASGIVSRTSVIIETQNYGNVTAPINVSGISYYGSYIINSENHGEITGESNVVGISAAPSYIFGTDNYGKIVGKIIDDSIQYKVNFLGIGLSSYIYDCNNYGDIETTVGSYGVGIANNGSHVYNSGNTGTITAHDFTTTEMIYYTPLLASGASTIQDSDIASDTYIQKYQDIMGEEFVSENVENYNTGDIYVTNVNAGGIGVSMVGNSGVGPVYNVNTNGNMYITNVTTTKNSSTFTRIATDGGNYYNITSIGDIIIDNYNGAKDLYVTGVGCSGASVYNSSSDGLIEVKNSTAGSSELMTYDNYSYYSKTYPYIAAGTSSGGYMENSYTTGEIKVHDNNFPVGLYVGGLTGSGAGATRSYSTRTVEVKNNTSNDEYEPFLYVGGLAVGGGRGVQDSYNRGDISVIDNSFLTLYASGGNTGGMSYFGGNYNSGNLYVKDTYAKNMILTGGGISGPFWNNYYNYGDITLETDSTSRLTSLDVAGINTLSYNGYANLVNEGDITIPYIPTLTHLYVAGIFDTLSPLPISVNLYSLGDINIADGYTYGNSFLRGNIYANQGANYDATGVTPYASYVQDGYAMGLSEVNNSFRALDANYGVKINATEKPNVLDIINVNDAFELKQGETLPTLKVFN